MTSVLTIACASTPSWRADSAVPSSGHDLEVALRQALAEQVLVCVDDRARKRAFDRTDRHAAGTVAADAFAAGVGHLDAGLERGI